MTDITGALGASASEWSRFAGTLGLTADLLPVVADTTTPISPDSNMKALGKTPSRINANDQAVGFPKWTQHQATPAEVKRWAADPRLGICLQTRTVRAIDVDVTDPAQAAQIRSTLALMLGPLPLRWRENSTKFLVLVHCPGDLHKHVIKTEHGIIELLATGQQCVVAGTHPSGAALRWLNLDDTIPEVSLDELMDAWAALTAQFGLPGSAGAESAAVVLERPRRAADALTDPVVDYLEAQGLVSGWGADGKVFVRCPHALQHTSDNGPSETVWMPAGVGGLAEGGFECRHRTHGKITTSLFLSLVGYTAAEVHDEFEDVTPTPEEAAAEAAAPRRPRPHEVIPEARHLCTDQANVQRIIRAFGKRLLVAADRWHAWDGKRWVPDDAVATRYAMNLSRLIGAEAESWAARKATTAEEEEKNAAIAKALRSWATKSEMKGAIDAALGLAKRVLAVDTDKMDGDPWLLNCDNGTVDLRTGQIKAHDPFDYITKVCTEAYDPAAAAPAFEQVLRRVCLEENCTPLVSSFLRRWFGYCATASTREQKFVVHYGLGSNGKSTILDIVSEVMGDYASTAAPGLLVASAKERHPTEIADLFSRRMVTAHESSEGGVLREDFIKQATGGDRIKARYMRADFFEFAPTHKLQLLTNHKPTIKGQDTGIWRRVVMVPYMARFGTAEEVATGVAHFPKEVDIMERLRTERPGVLAWLVAGAVEWYRDGLNPPDSVQAAVSAYQKEQDRVLSFIGENCETGRGYTAPLTTDMGDGLFQIYESWCKEGNFFALSKTRFLQELERLVPGFETKSVQDYSGMRKRKVTKCLGIRFMEGEVEEFA